MAREQLLIIGGVAAGMSAASRARKRNAQLAITVLEKGPHVAYAACGLPYLLSGQVATPEALVVYTADFFRERRNIDVRLGCEAVAIHTGSKTVEALLDGSRPVRFAYDKLILTAGGGPASAPRGSDLSNVFTCNDLAGTLRLRSYIEQHTPRRAVILGSGYIGLEVAEALACRGMDVTVLERSSEILGGVEPEIGAQVEETLARRGVRLVRSAEATSITGDAQGRAVAVQYGLNGSVSADLVLLATGIVPRVALAEAAGIALGRTGAIAVDERMQTGTAGIYAAGDCAEVHHLVTGKAAYFPLGTTANKQGRVAGENAAGGNARMDGIVGTLVTRIFDLAVARTGLGMQQAASEGFHPQAVVVKSLSRARYLGGKPILLKLIWDRDTGRVLGCQMAGEEGVAKRIDVAAMALHARMRVDDLLHLDLSYAPPFAPVWEAILVAANEARKKPTQP